MTDSQHKEVWTKLSMNLTMEKRVPKAREMHSPFYIAPSHSPLITNKCLETINTYKFRNIFLQSSQISQIA